MMDFFSVSWSIAWRLGLVLGILAIGLYATYFMMSLPMRRRERARLFLDLLETGVKDGQTPERLVLEIAKTRDLSVGVRFYLLAAHIEEGCSLAQALERVPRLLPPKATAMLVAGLESGQLERVLPVCRELLEDSHSQIRKAQHYLMSLGFVTTPIACYVAIILLIFVVPKFRDILKDMEAGTSQWIEFMIQHQPHLVGLQFAIIVCVVAATTIYVGGPRVTTMLTRIHPTFARWLLYSTPWQRRRGQRDFSAMLAIFLDAGMAEKNAVQMAASATANPMILERAERVIGDLAQGRTLTDALAHIDDAGEFRWRLDNAARGQGGFQNALAGWQEALDAKAFQLEQSATQLISTALILLNGAVVAMVVLCLFHPLIQLVQGATLW